jgi:hypothetical protein
MPQPPPNTVDEVLRGMLRAVGVEEDGFGRARPADRTLVRDVLAGFGTVSDAIRDLLPGSGASHRERERADKYLREVRAALRRSAGKRGSYPRIREQKGRLARARAAQPRVEAACQEITDEWRRHGRRHLFRDIRDNDFLRGNVDALNGVLTQVAGREVRSCVVRDVYDLGPNRGGPVRLAARLLRRVFDVPTRELLRRPGRPSRSRGSEGPSGEGARRDV